MGVSLRCENCGKRIRLEPRRGKYYYHCNDSSQFCEPDGWLTPTAALVATPCRYVISEEPEL